MKKSEIYERESAQEENDIKAFGLLCKALREKRKERFEENWLSALCKEYKVEQRANGSFSIYTDKYGIIDHFPKANKLLIRQKNKWIKPGLKGIIKNLLK